MYTIVAGEVHKASYLTSRVTYGSSLLDSDWRSKRQRATSTLQGPHTQNERPMKWETAKYKSKMVNLKQLADMIYITVPVSHLSGYLRATYSYFSFSFLFLSLLFLISSLLGSSKHSAR